MADPTPPWVRYKSYPTPSIDSTEAQILITEHTTFINAILVTNISPQDIFIYVYSLQERSDTDKKTFQVYKRPLKSYESADLIAGMRLSFEPTDRMYAYSDLSGNFFDCNVMVAELMEV